MSPARSVVAVVVTWLLVAATSARSEHANTGHCAVVPQKVPFEGS